jgi:hypothetical protein
LACSLEALRGLWRAPGAKRSAGLWWLTFSGIIVTHISYGWHFLGGLWAGQLKEEKVPAAA